MANLVRKVIGKEDDLLTDKRQLNYSLQSLTFVVVLSEVNNLFTKGFSLIRSQKYSLLISNIFIFAFMSKQDEENKLVNAIISLSQEIKGMRQDMEKQLEKINLSLGEMRISYMKLDDSFNRMSADFNNYAKRNDDRATNHETRIVRLENKTSGSSFVAEPKAKYLPASPLRKIGKKRKKKK